MSKIECLWQSPPSALNISTNEVHVWRIPLDRPMDQIQRMTKILAPDERLRSNSFRFESHRRRYIASHGALREIFGKYICIEPGQLEFDHRPLGKPFLASNENTNQLCFNLSLSNEIALCAVTLNRSIGIDVEYKRKNIDVESLARRFFSIRECELISSSSPEERKNVFFDLWTLKEAYLKATGQGISALKQVEISMSSSESPTLFVNDENIQVKNRWTMLQMIPSTGYIASMVIEGSGGHIYNFYNF